MSSIERLTVTMPAEMAGVLRHTVEAGEYASASEIVREALRDWTRRRRDDHTALADLREAVRVGDESGPSIPAAEVFAEMRALIAELRSNTQ